MISRAQELLVKGWLATTQAVTLLVGLGIATYLIIRPFLPNTVPLIDVHHSVGAVIATWPALIGNTVLIAGVASTMSLMVSLPLAYVLFRTNLPGRTLLTAGLILLACLPVFVTSSAVMALLGFRTTLGNPFFVGLIHGWIGIPISLLQLGLGYLCLDRTLEEAASCEASRLRVWTHVDWPQLRWSVITVVLVQVWFAGTEVTVSDMLSVRTFAEEVYVTYQLSGSTALQSLVVAPFVVGLGLLVWGMAASLRRMDLHAERFSALRAAILPLHRSRWPLTILVAALILFLVFIPFRTLLSQIDSPSHFVRLVGRLGEELADSILLAGLTGLATVGVTMGIVVRTVSNKGMGRWLWGSLILLFAWPSPCLAIALIELLNQPGLLGTIYDSPAALIAGQTLRWLPLAVLLTAPALILITRETIDAAQLDGCNGAGLHIHMYWPLAKAWLVLAGVVTMIMVLGEVTISVLLSPPGFLPLSVRFFTLVHYGLQNEAAAICCLVVLIVLLPWGVLCYLLNGSRR